MGVVVVIKKIFLNVLFCGLNFYRSCRDANHFMMCVVLPLNKAL